MAAAAEMAAHHERSPPPPVSGVASSVASSAGSAFGDASLGAPPQVLAQRSGPEPADACQRHMGDAAGRIERQLGLSLRCRQAGAGTCIEVLSLRPDPPPLAPGGQPGPDGREGRILEGDMLRTVNGTVVNSMPLDELQHLLLGPPGGVPIGPRSLPTLARRGVRPAAVLAPVVVSWAGAPLSAHVRAHASQALQWCSVS